ncbi:MAG TPA: Trm112 family protein [Verrucomicrobiae bacterium]|nr:Trm112 family protein [Verrucomicrobiae bacterium]
MVDAELLKLLCCPETHQPLRPADSLLLEQLNGRIATKGLSNRAGRAVAERIQEGLVRADGKVLYPIRNGIPVMLVDESILVEDQPSANNHKP